MMGISFAGGLSIVAAGAPVAPRRVAFVVSFGGHGDLPASLRYLCTGIQPDGVDASAARLWRRDHSARRSPTASCPRTGGAAARRHPDTFLEARGSTRGQGAGRRRISARARDSPTRCPNRRATLMRYVNERDVAHLGPMLAATRRPRSATTRRAFARRATPAPRAPVFLLHGTGDNVIPAIESVLLADTLRSRGVDVHQLADAASSPTRRSTAPQRRPRCGAWCVLGRTCWTSEYR